MSGWDDDHLDYEPRDEELVGLVCWMIGGVVVILGGVGLLLWHLLS